MQQKASIARILATLLLLTGVFVAWGVPQVSFGQAGGDVPPGYTPVSGSESPTADETVDAGEGTPETETISDPCKNPKDEETKRACESGAVYCGYVKYQTQSGGSKICAKTPVGEAKCLKDPNVSACTLDELDIVSCQTTNCFNQPTPPQKPTIFEPKNPEDFTKSDQFGQVTDAFNEDVQQTFDTVRERPVDAASEALQAISEGASPDEVLNRAFEAAGVDRVPTFGEYGRARELLGSLTRSLFDTSQFQDLSSSLFGDSIADSSFGFGQSIAPSAPNTFGEVGGLEGTPLTQNGTPVQTSDLFSGFSSDAIDFSGFETSLSPLTSLFTDISNPFDLSFESGADILGGAMEVNANNFSALGLGGGSADVLLGTAFNPNAQNLLDDQLVSQLEQVAQSGEVDVVIAPSNGLVPSGVDGVLFDNTSVADLQSLGINTDPRTGRGVGFVPLNTESVLSLVEEGDWGGALLAFGQNTANFISRNVSRSLGFAQSLFGGEIPTPPIAISPENTVSTADILQGVARLGGGQQGGADEEVSYDAFGNAYNTPQAAALADRTTLAMEEDAQLIEQFENGTGSVSPADAAAAQARIASNARLLNDVQTANIADVARTTDTPTDFLKEGPNSIANESVFTSLWNQAQEFFGITDAEAGYRLGQDANALGVTDAEIKQMFENAQEFTLPDSNVSAAEGERIWRTEGRGRVLPEASSSANAKGAGQLLEGTVRDLMTHPNTPVQLREALIEKYGTPQNAWNIIKSASDSARRGISLSGEDLRRSMQANADFTTAYLETTRVTHGYESPDIRAVAYNQGPNRSYLKQLPASPRIDQIQIQETRNYLTFYRQLGAPMTASLPLRNPNASTFTTGTLTAADIAAAPSPSFSAPLGSFLFSGESVANAPARLSFDATAAEQSFLTSPNAILGDLTPTAFVPNSLPQPVQNMYSSIFEASVRGEGIEDYSSGQVRDAYAYIQQQGWDAVSDGVERTTPAEDALSSQLAIDVEDLPVQTRAHLQEELDAFGGIGDADGDGRSEFVISEERAAATVAQLQSEGMANPTRDDVLGRVVENLNAESIGLPLANPIRPYQFGIDFDASPFNPSSANQFVLALPPNASIEQRIEAANQLAESYGLEDEVEYGNCAGCQPIPEQYFYDNSESGLEAGRNYTTEVRVNGKALKALARATVLNGEKLPLSSVYRSPAQDRALGGGSGAHTTGSAFDFPCAGSECTRLYKVAANAGFNNVYYGRGHIHADMEARGSYDRDGVEGGTRVTSAQRTMAQNYIQRGVVPSISENDIRPYNTAALNGGYPIAPTQQLMVGSVPLPTANPLRPSLAMSGFPDNDAGFATTYSVAGGQLDAQSRANDAFIFPSYYGEDLGSAPSGPSLNQRLEGYIATLQGDNFQQQSPTTPASVRTELLGGDWIPYSPITSPDNGVGNELLDYEQPPEILIDWDYVAAGEDLGSAPSGTALPLPVRNPLRPYQFGVDADVSPFNRVPEVSLEALLRAEEQAQLNTRIASFNPEAATRLFADNSDAISPLQQYLERVRSGEGESLSPVGSPEQLLPVSAPDMFVLEPINSTLEDPDSIALPVQPTFVERLTARAENTYLQARDTFASLNPFNNDTGSIPPLSSPDPVAPVPGGGVIEPSESTGTAVEPVPSVSPSVPQQPSGGGVEVPSVEQPDTQRPPVQPTDVPPPRSPQQPVRPSQPPVVTLPPAPSSPTLPDTPSFLQRFMQSGLGGGIGNLFGGLANLFGGGGEETDTPQGGGGNPLPPSQEPDTRTPRLSCNPDSIVNGQRVTIQWSCPNSNTSTGIGFSTGGPASGEITTEPIDTDENSVEFGVRCASAAERSCTVEVVHPVVTFIANPQEVESGETAELLWTSVETSACAVFGPAGERLVLGESAGSVRTAPLEQAVRFRLACQTAGVNPVVSEVVVQVEGDERPPLESEIPENVFRNIPAPNQIEPAEEQVENSQGSGAGMLTDPQTGEAVPFCDPADGIWKFTQCLLTQ